MSTKFKPASPEELAARGVLPVEPEVAEAAPADPPVEAEPVAVKAPARKASKKAA
jgi:hypothetical protein